MKKDVKFYGGGGHSAGREMEDRPGIVVAVSIERYRQIVDDKPGTLRSPYRLYNE